MPSVVETHRLTYTSTVDEFPGTASRIDKHRQWCSRTIPELSTRSRSSYFSNVMDIDADV